MELLLILATTRTCLLQVRKSCTVPVRFLLLGRCKYGRVGEAVPQQAAHAGAAIVPAGAAAGRLARNVHAAHTRPATKGRSGVDARQE